MQAGYLRLTEQTLLLHEANYNFQVHKFGTVGVFPDPDPPEFVMDCQYCGMMIKLGEDIDVDNYTANYPIDPQFTIKRHLRPKKRGDCAHDKDLGRVRHIADRTATATATATYCYCNYSYYYYCCLLLLPTTTTATYCYSCYSHC